MKAAGKLVWVAGLKGPYAEKWAADMPSGGRSGKTVIAEYDLNQDQFGMSIAILEQRFPPPGAKP